MNTPKIERGERAFAEFAILANQAELTANLDALFTEAETMLSQAANASTKSIFTNESIAPALTALIEETPFTNAYLVQVDGLIHGSFAQAGERVSRIETIGQYPLGGKLSGAFNVWFAYSNGQWYLKYNKIPDTGNLRGDLG